MKNESVTSGVKNAALEKMGGRKGGRDRKPMPSGQGCFCHVVVRGFSYKHLSLQSRACLGRHCIYFHIFNLFLYFSAQ